MTINAKHFVGLNRTDVPEVPDVPGFPYPALPTGAVWLKEGIYAYNGKNYDCKEGLVVFFNESNGDHLNLVVFKDHNGNSDLYKLISGYCWNHVHATDDNYADTPNEYQIMSNSGRYRKWRAQCGPTAGCIAWVLQYMGFPNDRRVINFVTQNPNGWDDGHIVLETRHSNGSGGYEWRMWDTSHHCYFRDENGKHMSGQDFIDALANDDPITKVLLTPERDYDSDNSGNFCLSTYQDMKHFTDQERWGWYKHICQSYIVL